MDAVTVIQSVLAALKSGNMPLNQTEPLSSNVTAPSPAEPFGVALSILNLPAIVARVLSIAAVRDWLKLLFVGAVLEMCRRALSSSWSTIQDYFWITATLEEVDDCGHWLLYWLSRHRVFRTARTLDVSTRMFRMNSPIVSDPNSDGTTSTRGMSFLPSLHTTYRLWHNYHYVTVTRSQITDGPWQTKQTLRIQIFARKHEVLKELLLQAKSQYLEASENMISIYVSTSDYWKRMCMQRKRSMQSIILDPGMIDLVLNDAKDFLASAQWYSERGIPHRRGYLLHGAPGAGKTSLIHSIAGELDVDIYVLSLTRAGMDDSTLHSVIADLPDRCIVLVEDIDAAFRKGMRRRVVDLDKERPGVPEGHNSLPQEKECDDSLRSPITLSGLLNALDGIGAQQGRILFATTNDYAALDPALCRPGRLDLHVEFKLASSYQCRKLFWRFYHPSPDRAAEKLETHGERPNEREAGHGSPCASMSPSSACVFSSSVSASHPAYSAAAHTSVQPVATYVGIAHTTGDASLSVDNIDELARRFAAHIPDRTFSMATLQGYLMMYKSRPYDAVSDVGAWVAKKERERGAGVRSNGPNAAVDSAHAPAITKYATAVDNE